MKQIDACLVIVSFYFSACSLLFARHIIAFEWANVNRVQRTEGCLPVHKNCHLYSSRSPGCVIMLATVPFLFLSGLHNILENFHLNESKRARASLGLDAFGFHFAMALYVMYVAVC